MNPLRRNTVVAGATIVLVGALFLYPTSTNRTNDSPAAAARPGIVTTGPSSSSGGVKVIVVNGESAGTRYGPVQVKVTIRGSRIASVTAITAPSSGDRDRAISAFALPQLAREAVSAQSAHIDTVSGATFTSDGYRRSLQSALDAAHLHKPAG